VALLATSALLMPWVARAKRRLALALGSGALVADATQTAICAWLSAIALAGVAANAALGWWWGGSGGGAGHGPDHRPRGGGALRGRSCCAHAAARPCAPRGAGHDPAAPSARG
jgi:hypothetical protein